MSAFETLLVSNVWDDRIDLPAVKMHLNPHIYTAYSVRVLEAAIDLTPSVNREGALTIRGHYKNFLASCERAPGLITTYEGQHDSSHDDAYGAAFLNEAYAARLVALLNQNDGVYATGQADDERRNFYRFLFLRPALRAFANERVGLLSQLLYVVALLLHLWTTNDGSTSGHLLLWLSFPKMREYRVTGAFIDYWAEKWTARGYTPSTIFSKNYLTECPWFAQWARNDWL